MRVRRRKVIREIRLSQCGLVCTWKSDRAQKRHGQSQSFSFPEPPSVTLMAKQKPSASSGTRKKHAKRAAGPEAIPTQQQPKIKDKGKKGAKKEPKQKSYVAPVKPVAAQPDPLDTTGLAHRLPSELVVILRTLTKKATVTKAKALEDLQAGWVNRDSEDTVDVLVDLLPVWVCFRIFSAAFLSLTYGVSSCIISPHCLSIHPAECGF